MDRSYSASKLCSFSRITIHLMFTHNGYPVEFVVTSGSYSDTVSLEGASFDYLDVRAEAGICVLPVLRKMPGVPCHRG